MDKKITSTIFLFVATLLAGCNSSSKDLEKATTLFLAHDKTKINAMVVSNSTKWQYPRSCSSSKVNNYLVGQAIQGMGTVLEFKEAGASRAQLVAIARREIGSDIAYHVSTHKSMCKNLNTIYTEMDIRVSLRMVIDSMAGDNSDEEVARMENAYETYLSNIEVNECKKIKEQSSQPIERQSSGANWDELYTLINCDSFQNTYPLTKDFVTLSEKGEGAATD